MAQTATQIPSHPTLDEPSDAVVIERSLRRPERFAAVFDRHYAAIHAAAMRITTAIVDEPGQRP